MHKHNAPLSDRTPSQRTCLKCRKKFDVQYDGHYICPACHLSNERAFDKRTCTPSSHRRGSILRNS